MKDVTFFENGDQCMKPIFFIVTVVLTISICIFKSINAISESQISDVDLKITQEEPTQIVTTQENLESHMEKSAITSYEISDFPLVLQLPELPTGCEVTALTMILNYYGLDIGKVEVAENALPKLPVEFWYDENGTLFGNNMEDYFIGDPETENGYICGTSAIIQAANQCFSDYQINASAIDTTGAEPIQLYRWIDENIPVLVWVTIGMQERSEVQGWYTEEGVFMDWSTNDHGAVLIGYSETTVTVADPLAGIVKYDRKQFENVYKSRNQKSIRIQR